MYWITHLGVPPLQGADVPAAPMSEELLAELRQLGLRHFTPAEIAALHSFPPSFQFPPHVTLRQRYALLGNSLSASVVAALLRYLLRPEHLCSGSAGAAQERRAA